MNNITISNTAIRRDAEGRYSLPQSPRETQPHWYVSRFESLLKEVLQ